MIKLNRLYNLAKTVITLTTVSILAFSCSSIGDEYYDLSSNQTNNTIKTLNSENNFVKELEKKNIFLNEEELNMVIRLKNVEPAGRWTPGPEDNSEANMVKHFEKHGEDFEPPIKSVQDYFQKAILASKSPNGKYYFDTKPYFDSKIVSLVKWNSKTKEFTVTRENGQIATYFLNAKVKADRYVVVPEDFGNE